MPRPLTKKELESLEQFTPISNKVEGGLNKKVENFWYHYKFYVVTITCSFAAILALILFVVSEAKADLTVCLAGSYVWIDNDTIADMKVALADNVKDVNGDGHVVVNVVRGFMINNKQKNSANYDELLTYQQQFLAGLLSGQFFVIIADPYVASVLDYKDLYEDLTRIDKDLPSGVCGVDIADTNLLDNAPELAQKLKGFRLIPRKWSEGDMEIHPNTKEEVFCAKQFFKSTLKDITQVTPFVSLVTEEDME